MSKNAQLGFGYGYDWIIENSDKFNRLMQETLVSTKLSLTGMTNLIVNYEDPFLVQNFLDHCFKKRRLYKETCKIDAVELQRGTPGNGLAAQHLDKLIFGTFEMENDADGMPTRYKLDPRTGARKRNPDGLVNRKEVLKDEAHDTILIINNIDQCVDFCERCAGHVDNGALWIFDNFRNPNTRLQCKLLLVTNEKLVLPFKIRRVNLDPIDDFEADQIVDDFVALYRQNNYEISFSDSQKDQIKRKICGLTYTEAADVLAESLSQAGSSDAGSSKKIDTKSAVKRLRSKINRNLMENASGLTCLSPKPWEDYICAESSNFTYDVKKMLRDFEEIKTLRGLLKKATGDKEVKLLDLIDAIRNRIPHTVVLYGKGGVGKSAFPIHFAGLLEFDVWDFNINAVHSKFIGEGGERVRASLDRIVRGSHLVVRIDEYDRSMGSTQSSGQGMHEAHKQVESEFMNWLQNCQEENIFKLRDIFLFLTTNHKENITGPLLRSGRIDLVIDIAEFDQQSLKETFLSAPRRMKNRGINVIGFDNVAQFTKAIEGLDLDTLATLSANRGFTVRDIDTLLQEMAAHQYYHKRNKIGAPWTTDTFVAVLENSEGSAKGEDTNELILGDRVLFGEEEEVFDPQATFDFYESCNDKFSLEKMKNSKFFID